MRGSGNNRGGSSNRGGGGRGGFVYRPKKKKVTTEEPERDTSPPRDTTPEKASDVVRTPDTTTTVRKEKEKGGKPPVKQNTAPVDTRPRSKGDQRKDTQKKPPQPKQKTQAVWAPKPERVKPKIGDPSEEVTPEHINWVRDQFDRANLKTVWEGLAAEHPRRDDLMKAVVRQAIRAGIYEVMGTGMKSMANIHVDGTPLAFTEARGVRDDKDLDVELTDKDGSARDVAVWNASRGDAEVEAIRDVMAWASLIDPRTLSGKEKVVLQIVGNSGSCEACQKRLTAMADKIQSEWRRRAPDADLPRLDIMCYYSNDMDKVFGRGGYDTYNGWSEDVASPDLSLTGQGKKARFLEVYEHQLLSYSPAPKRPEVADTSPESTITPVTIIPGTQKDNSKPSKEEDIS